MKCSLLLFYTTAMNHFLIGLWCVMRHGFYMTNGSDQLSGWTGEEAPKHFPKSNTHPKKVLVTVWCSAAHLIHYSFLNLGETTACEKLCSANWRAAQKTEANIGPQNSPILLSNARPHGSQPALPKLNELGRELLPHPPYSPDLSPTSCHFFKHLDNFLQGKTPRQPAGGRKCFPRVHWILKHRFLCCRNKPTYFSLAKMYRL